MFIWKMDGHTTGSSSQQLPPFTTAKLQFPPLARQYIWLDFLLSLIEVTQLRRSSSKKKTPIKSPPDESGLILLVEIPLKKKNNNCNSSTRLGSYLL